MRRSSDAARLRSFRSIFRRTFGKTFRLARILVQGKEARHAAAVPVVTLPGRDLPASAVASPLGRADLPLVPRRANSELSGDACARVGTVPCVAGRVEQFVQPPETAAGRLHALAGTRRLRAGVHSGCGKGQSRVRIGPRSVAHQKGRAFARAAGGRGGVGAGSGLGLGIIVSATMDDGARIERSTDASAGTNDGAASAEPGRLHPVRLRRRGTAAPAWFAYVHARP